MVHQEEVSVDTTGHGDIHDITGGVTAIVERSGVRTGTVHIFHVGSTGCVGAIEFEPGLERDISEILDRLMPPSRSYGHEQQWQRDWILKCLCRPVRNMRVNHCLDPHTLHDSGVGKVRRQ